MRGLALLLSIGCHRGETDNRLAPWVLPLMDPPTLTAPVIQGTLKDGAGRLWIATEDGAVLRVGPGRDEARRYWLDGVDTMPDGAFQGMRLGKNGVEVWVEASADAPAGRYVYDAETDAFQRDNAPKELPPEPNAPLRVPASCSVGLDLQRGAVLAEPDRGTLRDALHLGAGWRAIAAIGASPEAVWLGTDRGPLDIDRATGEVGTRAGPCLPVADLCADDAGTVWAASGTTLLSRTLGGSWKTWDRAIPDALLGQGGQIRDLSCAAQNSIWVGTDDGYAVLDRAKGAVIGQATLALDTAGDERLNALLPWPDGTVWIGTTKGLHRYKGATEVDLGSQLLSLNILGSVTALTRDAEGALWIGTPQGVWQHQQGSTTRLLRKADAARTERRPNAPAGTRYGKSESNTSSLPDSRLLEALLGHSGAALSISDMAIEPGGALWLAGDQGSYRYDPNQDPWAEAFTQTGFRGLYTDAPATEVAVAPTGEIWLSFASALRRLARTSRAEQAPAYLRTEIDPRHPTYGSALDEDGPLWILRGDVLDALALDHRSQVSAPVALETIPRGATGSALAPGPLGGVWMGTSMGALSLRAPGRPDLLDTAQNGLPAANIDEISAVPKDPCAVWVMTGLGLTRVRATGRAGTWPNALAVETWIGIADLSDHGAPASRRLVRALPDGSAVVAWSSEGEASSDPAPARGPASHLRHVSADGALGPVLDLPADKLPLSLAWEGDSTAKGTLWMGTDAGLYRWDRPTDPETAPVLVDAGGKLPATPIQHIAVDPRGSVWFSSTAGGSSQVIGYDPGQQEIRVFGVAVGMLRGRIDALWLDPEGYLVVQSGDTFARGKVYVPRRPLPGYLFFGLLGGLAVGLASLRARRRDPIVERARQDPATLQTLPLATLAGALTGLRRARALDRTLKALDLPAARFAELSALIGAPRPEGLSSLAHLLGASAVGQTSALSHGLWLLPARLPEPAALGSADTPLVALDPNLAFPSGEAAVQVDPISTATVALANGLAGSGRRPDLPFVLLCPDPTAARKIASDPGMLVLAEAELRTLLFARSPAQALTGLLLARRALHVRPYSAVGHVETAEMFFGRAELRRALAADARAIVVGPRRVGKTSLLRRVEADFRGRTGEIEAVYLDIMGVVSVAALGERLAEVLSAPMLAGSEDAPTLLRALQTWLLSRDRRLALLIDEADGLVLADQAAGWPLLWGLRSLVAEGRIGVTLAGYLHLFRGALDQRSPLYNFGAIHRLGPLERPAAVALVTEPMARVGIRYADPGLVKRVVALTGGFPNLLQELCAGLIEALGDDPALTITAAHLEAAGQALALKRLEDFHYNTSAAGRLLVYALLDRTAFTLVEARAALERCAHAQIPAAILERLLQELELRGLISRERADQPFAWAVPLLLSALRADATPAAEMIAMLKGELAPDPAQWG